MNEEKLPSLKETKMTDSVKPQVERPVTKPDMKQMHSEDMRKKDKLEAETNSHDVSEKDEKPQESQVKASFLGRFGSRVSELWKEKSKRIREMV